MARRTIVSVVALVAAVTGIGTAGCGSSRAASGDRPTSVRPSRPTSKGTTMAVPAGGSWPRPYGAPAQQLAARVPGCVPHAVSVRTGAIELRLPRARRLFAHARSAATCTLQGRTALLLSYPNVHSEAVAAGASYAITAYFAAGRGWLAVPVDLSEPVGQQSVVQDIALALGGQIRIGATVPRATAPGR